MTDADTWHESRKRELEARAPAKRKKAEPFVQVRLSWAARAAKATRTPKALVWVRLLYLAWRHKTRTFALPNKWLEAHGVSRFTKNRALSELEAEGLIAVERQRRKSPRVTII